MELQNGEEKVSGRILKAIEAEKHEVKHVQNPDKGVATRLHQELSFRKSFCFFKPARFGEDVGMIKVKVDCLSNFG